MQGNYSAVCSLTVGGETRQSFLLNDTSTQHSLQLMGDGQCEVRMLAVGGGGYGTSYGGGGGGSGFIAYYADVLPGFTELTVTVGDSDEFLSDSSKVLANGEVILEAGPGRSGGYGGGDGFSGGGGDSSNTNSKYHGGSNGADGEGSSGGDGTQQDITSFKFDSFVLSGGEGGFLHAGGGGGGVLVGGAGPARQHLGQGQGYGGGGEGQLDWESDYSPSGLPGLVIIEVRHKK